VWIGLSRLYHHRNGTEGKKKAKRKKTAQTSRNQDRGKRKKSKAGGKKNSATACRYGSEGRGADVNRSQKKKLTALGWCRATNGEARELTIAPHAPKQSDKY